MHNPTYTGLCNICFDGAATVDETASFGDSSWMNRCTTTPASGGIPQSQWNADKGDSMGQGIPFDQTQPMSGNIFAHTLGQNAFKQQNILNPI